MSAGIFAEKSRCRIVIHLNSYCIAAPPVEARSVSNDHPVITGTADFQSAVGATIAPLVEIIAAKASIPGQSVARTYRGI